MAGIIRCDKDEKLKNGLVKVEIMRKYIGSTLAGVTLLMSAASAHATLVDVYALAHSFNSGAGTGLATISLTAEDLFSITAGPGDLWNAGELPRWSNADGLAADFYATGSDESGQAIGTQIGQNWGTFTDFVSGFSAPYGALVGRIGTGSFFLVGTSFSDTASNSGILNLFYWDAYTPDNTEFITVDIQTNAVPEPATMLLFGLGLTGLAAARRKSRK
jgi:PEP-CTERM motif